MPDPYSRSLADLERRGRLRRVERRIGHDFASNDYLGLAQSDDLRQAAFDALNRGVPVGAGGSRLLRGNHPEHEALEAEAAAFFGAETALYFGGGFVANFALFSTLPQREDLIVHDALIHASARQGMQAGRAPAVEVPHNDASAFEREIRRWRNDGGTGTPWIAVETLYSMDGDFAPVDALIDIADRYGAMVVLDEAHATGVFGSQGRGLGAPFEGRSNVVSLHTCGKALGSVGAFICASQHMRDFLVNRSKPFIYATAPTPLDAAIVRAALKLSRSQSERRERLQSRITRTHLAMEEQCGLPAGASQILPVVVGSDARAVALAGAMQAQGFDIRAIRPPTVPEGTARVRISLTLNASDEVTAHMVGSLATELARLAR